MKVITYEKTFNDTIIKLKFQTIPRKGWFKENCQPAIDIIKATIPAVLREYNPSDFSWSFPLEYWEPLEKIFQHLGFTLKLRELASGSSATQNVNVPKDYADNFYRAPETPTATKESIENIASSLSVFLGVTITNQDLTELKKLYRAKARQLHPDFGGSSEQMSELNRLWTLYSAGGVQ